MPFPLEVRISRRRRFNDVAYGDLRHSSLLLSPSVTGRCVFEICVVQGQLLFTFLRMKCTVGISQEKDFKHFCGGREVLFYTLEG